MAYQKISNLLGNENPQPSRFRTKNWIEINDDTRRTDNTKSIKFKATVLTSSLCNFSDTHTYF